jgi:hypothetical protein
MNELLHSIKADLTSRRLVPLVALLCVGLLGAVAYAAIGGGGEAKQPTPVASTPLPSGLPVTVAPPKATAAAAETPAGSRYQAHDPVRDPFLPLPGAAAGPASAGATGGSGSTTAPPASGGATGSTKGSAGPTTGPKGAPAPTPKKKSSSKSPTSFKPRPLPLFNVSALFGLAPVTPDQQPSLTPYEDMLLYEPLPSAKSPAIVFIGVAKTGDQAVFALVVPPILRGPAACLPSQAQCQAIELSAGQTEELEYVKTNGEAVDYELQVVKISRRSGASAAAAKARRPSKAGLRALGMAGLLTFR